MLSSADESIHGLAVEIPSNQGSTPGRYNLQIEMTSHQYQGTTPAPTLSVTFHHNSHSSPARDAPPSPPDSGAVSSPPDATRSAGKPQSTGLRDELSDVIISEE